MGERLVGKIDAMGERLDGKVDALGERMDRLVEVLVAGGVGKASPPEFEEPGAAA